MYRLEFKAFSNISGLRHSAAIHVGWSLLAAFLFLNVMIASGQKARKSPWNEHPELFTAPQVTWIDSVGPDYTLMYEGPLYQGKKTKVFAFYSVPEHISGKIPAMVLAHGGGGKAFQNWTKQWAGYGYAAISMNLNGEDNDHIKIGCPRDDKNFNIEEAKLTDSWLYQAGAAIIRSVSFLESCPEIDKERIGIMGISWGGYHTSAVAGVDDRLSAAIIVYGCGGLYSNSVWTREGAKFSEAYIHHLDPDNFLPKARIPILWVNNNTDHFFPLDSHQSSRKLTAAKGYARIGDNYSHGYEPPWKTEDIRSFADAALRGGDPWPEILSSAIKKNKIKALVNQKLKSAWLVYTSEKEWMFKSVRIEGNEVWIKKEVNVDLLNNTVEAELPVNTIAAYLHMKDDKGREFSTDYFILSHKIQRNSSTKKPVK